MIKTSTKIIKKIMIFLFPVFIIMIFSITVFYYLQIRELTEKSLENSLKSIATTAISSLDGNMLEKITRKSDYNNDVYNTIHTILKRVSDNNNLEKNGVKILRLKGNFTSYIVTSDSKNYINEEYNLWFEMNSTFNSGSINIKKAYLRYGKTYISCFAPIKNDMNQIIGILEVDKVIDSYLPSIFNFLIFPFVLTLFILAAGIIILKILLRPFQRVINSYVEFFKKVLSEKSNTDDIQIENGYLTELNKSFEELKLELTKRYGSSEDKEKLQRQIKEMLRIVNTAANGDFTVNAQVTADTLGVLADSFNLMISDLSNLIRDVKKGVEHVSKFTKKTLETTTTMANGATNQAKEIEHINKLAKDMVKVAGDTSNSAVRASQSAQLAKQVAEKGGSVLKKSIDSMHHIREAVLETSKRVKLLGETSGRIGEITEFISYIANRTNLLSLNASIEAAKAGEEGRGFTIVADEVRKLATRSKHAVQEINKLIEDIKSGTSDAVRAMEQGNKEVAEGTKMVDEAGNALREILKAVDISTTSVEEISKATKQQFKSNEDIVNIMERIANIAHKTAEGAKESEKEITQLESLSKSLNNAVAKFNLAQQ